MDTFGGGVMNLQSGFVLAVIIAVVFLADRIGGSEQVAQRGFQVALGLGLVFVVLSGTNAFMGAPELPEALQGTLFDEDSPSTGTLDALEDNSRETAHNASEVRTVHVGAGLLLLLAGFAAVGRLRILPLGAILGGLLLLLFGSPQQQGGLSNFMDIFGSLFGSIFPGGGASDAGQAREIAYFAVLLAGTGALAALGAWRWEKAAP